MTAQSIIYTLETIPDGTVCPSFIQREFITTVASAGITAAGIGIIVGARKVHRARHVTKKRS